jgi:nicotinamidase-related amidase
MPRALVIIDFINEFIHPDGKVSPQGMGAFCREHDTLKHVKTLIDIFRANQEEIIWIHLGFHKNYDNCSKISPRFKGAPDLGILQEDTWSTEFVSELDYRPSETTFTKTRISPFYETGLEAYLRKR